MNLHQTADARIPTPAGTDTPSTSIATPTPDTTIRFDALGLNEPILRSVEAEGYTNPTPIQAQAIPAVLDGHDLLGIAQTGTGKTAAFVLPMLNRLTVDRLQVKPRTCRMLVVAPTRELAAQIADAARTYGRHLNPSVAVVVGGVSPRPQIRDLARGVDLLVATPGRLLDHVGTNAVRLTETQVVVLDEADQMLDLGFMPQIRRIMAALPKERQTMLFSATMPAPIRKLAEDFLRTPVEIRVTPAATPVEAIDQRVMFVDPKEKRALLASILGGDAVKRAIVFTRTKHGADKVMRHLDKSGISAAAIHGNKSQSQRERALDAFRSGTTRVLVATDIAARGIDVDGITHVVNYELPNVPESYVHRIGRTARAGADGIAIAFCAPEERPLLRDIERLIGRALPKQGMDGIVLAEMPTDDAGERSRPQQPRKARPARHARSEKPAQNSRNGSRPQRSRRAGGESASDAGDARKSNREPDRRQERNRSDARDRSQDRDRSRKANQAGARHDAHGDGGRAQRHPSGRDASRPQQNRPEQNRPQPTRQQSNRQHPNGDRPLTRQVREGRPADEAENAGLFRMLSAIGR